MIAKTHPNLDDLEQFKVLFTWQQRLESQALRFESSHSPAKLAKRFKSSNPDLRIRLTENLHHTAQDNIAQKTTCSTRPGG
jgi:hypothetical protein